MQPAKSYLPKLLQSRRLTWKSSIQQDGEQIRTDIADEDGLPPAKAGKRVWLYVGLGTALLGIIVTILIVAMRHRGDGPVASATGNSRNTMPASRRRIVKGPPGSAMRT